MNSMPLCPRSLRVRRRRAKQSCNYYPGLLRRPPAADSLAMTFRSMVVVVGLTLSDEEQWEDYVAETAGYPDGEE